ncbi:ATP-binding protein [Streptomyces sp. TRM66268-LWL]|uniref:ATP-binding protein n=1 Tax=Streptomyces polyasparticus TaxID=2767826 RepID=A0ABR7SKU2_9ACTN|nr:ATP-binding protein [Streptomyces polyasparticus]MBC9716090.1 ATP-binding protein [Streptomyces polyasparticus]
MNLEITDHASDLTFAQHFSATRRGARLARRLALHQLDDWGVPHGSEASDSAALVVAELAANAVTHGRVSGRDFELRLALDGVRLVIEVADARADRPPRPLAPCPLAEDGRGLQLVEALTEDWGVRERPGGVGKTVWAKLTVKRRPVPPGGLAGAL